MTRLLGIPACRVNPHELSKVLAERGAGRLFRPLLLLLQYHLKKVWSVGTSERLRNVCVSRSHPPRLPLLSHMVIKASPVAVAWPRARRAISHALLAPSHLHGCNDLEQVPSPGFTFICRLQVLMSTSQGPFKY